MPSSVSSGDLREGARYWGVEVGEKRVMEERERRTNATPATREPEGGGGGRECGLGFRVEGEVSSLKFRVGPYLAQYKMQT